MPQLSRTYTNKDVEKYLPKTNHPPDIMDDSPDIIDETPSPPDVMDDDSEPVVSNAKPVSDNEPDTFWEGFGNSYKTGEAQDVNTRSLMGYAKGAINLPKTIMSMIDSASSLYNDPSGTIKSIPQGVVSGIKGIYNTTKMAGSNPEAFGEMMGEMTGQPLVTAGLAKGAPGAIANTGKVLQNYPLTDWVPGSKFVVPPAVRRLDRNVISGAAGRGLESVGNKMRGTSKIRVVDGKIVEPGDSPFMEGEVIPEDIILPKELPPSKTSFYGREKNPNSIITPKPKERLQLSESKGSQYLDEGDLVDKRPLRDRIKEIENLPDELVEGQELTKSVKPKVRLNKDGTYTNLETGEVLDSNGKAVPVTKSKSTKPDIDKNSSFFKKNRK